MTQEIVKEKFSTLSDVKKSKELKTATQEVASYKIVSNSFSVNSQDDYKDASETCKNIKTLSKSIDNERKFFVDPYNLVVKKINLIFKEKVNSLSEIETSLKGKMITWYKEDQKIKREEHDKKEREHLENDRIERERIERENQKKMNTHLDEIIENPKEDIPVPNFEKFSAEKIEPVKVVKTIKTENVTSTVKKIWKWKIKDQEKIPSKYLTINAATITKDVLSGARDIPGLEIYSEDSIAVR